MAQGAPTAESEKPFETCVQSCGALASTSDAENDRLNDRLNYRSRREILLKSINVGVLASLFSFGAVERPKDLGVQVV